MMFIKTSGIISRIIISMISYIYCSIIDDEPDDQIVMSYFMPLNLARSGFSRSYLAL
jgi:hypothetical protein